MSLRQSQTMNTKAFISFSICEIVKVFFKTFLRGAIKIKNESKINGRKASFRYREKEEKSQKSQRLRNKKEFRWYFQEQEIIKKHQKIMRRFGKRWSIMSWVKLSYDGFYELSKFLNPNEFSLTDLFNDH